ncbi:MAG: hypothetical protein AAF699_16350 [Pseudomonadota bacterium]
MTAAYWLRVIPIAVILSCTACEGEVSSTSSLQRDIDRNLDSRNIAEDIELFIETRGWLYDFDEFRRRYQASDPAEEVVPAILGRNQIFIYVDNNDNFLRAEVERHFPF